MPVSQPITRENRVIFSSDERGFTAKEVVDCALVRGEIDPLWKDFLRVAECDRLANERELEVDEAALDSAAIAFRYKHDLITAEETERWLEDRGVSLAEFSEYLPANIGVALTVARSIRPHPAIKRRRRK